MITVEFYPGSMGLACFLTRLLGSENVDPGSWLLPVTAQVAPEDSDSLLALIHEEDDTIQMRQV